MHQPEPGRLRQLRALGLEPLSWRGRAVVSPAMPALEPVGLALAEGAGSAASIPAIPRRLRLWFATVPGDPFAGPQARLLDQVLRTLGVTREELAQEDTASLPVLAFGAGAPEGAIRIVDLARLRDPIEKRIAWPVLRRARRRLREVSS